MDDRAVAVATADDDRRQGRGRVVRETGGEKREWIRDGGRGRRRGW